MAVLPGAALVCIALLALWSIPGPVFLLSRTSLESVAEEILADDGSGASKPYSSVGMQDAGRGGFIGLLPVERTMRDQTRVFFELGAADLFKETGYLYAHSYPADFDGNCDVKSVRKSWWHLTCASS